MSDTIPEFLEYLKVEENRLPVTLERYRAYLDRCIELLGDCPVRAINAEKLSILKRKLLDAGISAATIATILSCLRSYLRFLRQVRGLPVFDPAKVRRPKIPQREVAYLSKEEVNRFCEAIPTHTWWGLRDRALVEVLCGTGMRISEALSLNRDQIDWERKEARIIGKGNKERKVYFAERTLNWLQQYLERRHDDHKAVFVTHGSPPARLKAQGTWRRFWRYSDRAGLSKKVYPHMLRHTMATTLLANGCPIGHIRSLLGHQHLQTTCKYYLGVISDAEVKSSHERYLSYEQEQNQKGRDDKANAPEPWEENLEEEITAG